MAFVPVNLIAVNDYLDPVDAVVHHDDIILFLNDTIYRFTIVIKNADTIFVTDSETLIYDVESDGVIKTPKIKPDPVAPQQDQYDYEVYIYKDGKITPSEAPPRIIVVS